MSDRLVLAYLRGADNERGGCSHLLDGSIPVAFNSRRQVDVISLVRKLRHANRLTEDDDAILTRLAEPAQRVERGDIMPEGSAPRSIVVILEGWACWYKQLENGKRQITSVFVPGDLCEPFGVVPKLLNHTLSALTPVVLARIAPHTLRTSAQASPGIEGALWWDLLLADALMREQLVSLGRRSAVERLGHFFCEMHVRLQMVGLAEGGSYELPLTQADLADLFGLSAVHVNRSLQELRSIGLLSLRERRVSIHDVNALRDFSMFDPAYLPLPNPT